MSDWHRLGLSVRATSTRVDEKFVLPLHSDGPSKLNWDWEVVDRGDLVFFEATFTPHDQPSRTLLSVDDSPLLACYGETRNSDSTSGERLRSWRHSSGDLELESRGLVTLAWSHKPALFDWLLGARSLRLAYRVHLCTLGVIRQEAEEEARVNAHIIRSQHIIPVRLLD
jgi:hypothetical protein